MGDFSFLSGPYVYEEATQGKEWNSLHALKGIGKEGKTVTLSITYIKWSFFANLFIASIAQSAEQQSMDWKVPGSNPGLRQMFFSLLLFFYLKMLLLHVKMAILYGNVIKLIIHALKVLISDWLWKNIILQWDVD